MPRFIVIWISILLTIILAEEFYSSNICCWTKGLDFRQPFNICEIKTNKVCCSSRASFIHIMKILSLNVCITIKPNEKWLLNICRNVDDVTYEWFKVHTKLDDCYFMLISGAKRPTMYKWTRLNIRGNIQHFCTFNWMIPNVISSDEFILTSAVCKGFLWHQLF